MLCEERKKGKKREEKERCDVRSDRHRAVVCTNVVCTTGWRGLKRCFKLQIIFRKRGTNDRALLPKMTCKDKASYGSSPPCIRVLQPMGLGHPVWCSAVALSCRATSHSARDCSSCASAAQNYFTQCSWQMKILRETHEYGVCSNWCSAANLQPTATHCDTLWNALIGVRQ